MWTPRLAARKNLATAIVRALEADIESGQLRPGDRLPTQRELAERIQVALGTVTRAYSIAKSQGLVTGTIGRGTFVPGQPDTAQNVIDLSRNMVSRDRRDRNIRVQLAVYGDPAQSAALLDEEQDPAGVLEHRAAAAVWISKPGFAPKADDIVICSGVQHGLHTILATISRPGDVLMTEAVTYAGIKAIAALSGLQLQGLPIDSEGLEPQAFKEACRRGARILYTAPTLQNPTAAVMSDSRRREIARIAESHGVSIIEDDVYGFLMPEAPLPIAAYAPANTYYLVSTSKSIAPGLRVGYAVCPAGMQPRIASTVRTTVWETSPLMTGLVTKWLQDGTAERIIAYKRAEVHARHELAKGILSRIPPPAHVTPHWWIPLPESWRPEDLVNECRRRGVDITPAATFAVGRDFIPDAVRVCLGALPDRRRLEEGLHIIEEILDRGPATGFTTT